MASKLRDVMTEMHTLSLENEKLRSDVKLASKNKSIDMPRLIGIISQHKQTLETMFQEQSKENSMRVSDMEQ
jgi:regulator of replication initiation timing